MKDIWITAFVLSAIVSGIVFIPLLLLIFAN